VHSFIPGGLNPFGRLLNRLVFVAGFDLAEAR